MDGMAADMWKQLAKVRQQEVCDLVIDYNWDLYKKQEREYLEKKIEYILFGPSENTLDEDTKTVIEKICKTIIERSHGESETYMAFIYVFWSSNGESLQSWPVFKVPKDSNNIDTYFIDINSRVYNNWKDFLQNNQFPPCEYCYPIDGHYKSDENGVVILEFGTSPASSMSNKVLQYLDYANAGLSFGTTAVAAASIFVPITGPLVQASLWLTRGICAYSAMRSGTTLYDRGTHKQSVGLKDGESRSCWLSLGGSALGAAASSAKTITAKMAQTGRVVGKTGCATVNALNVGSVAVNGLGLLHSGHGLIDKYKKDKLTSLDVVQFSASLLLFAHAAVNVQTAKTIIEETQKDVLQDFENNLRSNRHKRMFRKIVKNNRNQQNPIEGNAQVIRSLKHVNNVDDFFSALVRMDKQFRPTKSKVTFTEGGLIEVNENLSVDPTMLVEANKEQRLIILEATKKYAFNQISEAEFQTMTEGVLGETSLTTPSIDQRASLKELFGLGQSKYKYLQKFGPEFSYPLLSAYERMELMTILKKFAESDHEQILQIATVLLKALGWSSGLQYVEVACFVCGLIRNIASDETFGKTDVARNHMHFSKYCQAALQEVCRDPSNLLQIFNHVRSFFDVLVMRDIMPTQVRHIGLFEICQISSILLCMDKPLWLRVLTFSEEIFCKLNLRKPEMMIIVVKRLCLTIQKMLMNMDNKLSSSVTYVPNTQQIWNDEAKERSKEYCSTIIKTLTEDTEVHQSLIAEIQREHVPQISVQSPTVLKNTKQEPLVLNKHFWVEGELNLLSEEDILDICKQTLDCETWLLDCNIEYDGPNIFINIDDKLVVIECDFDEGKVSAYVDFMAAL